MTMRARTLLSQGPEQTQELARRIGELMPVGAVIAARGDLGAGKTLFAAALAGGLGVEEPVTSPTFIFFREYQGRIAFSHIDAYRLEGLEDEDIALTGVDEALARGKAAFVEWPEFLPGRLPGDRVELTIERCPEDEDRRKLTFSWDDEGAGRWIDAALGY